MASKALVLDANILIRAVLGKRVRQIIEQYAERVSLFVPESAVLEAEEHLAGLVLKRGGDPVKALELTTAYASYEEAVPYFLKLINLNSDDSKKHFPESLDQTAFSFESAGE